MGQAVANRAVRPDARNGTEEGGHHNGDAVSEKDIDGSGAGTQEAPAEPERGANIASQAPRSGR